MTGDVSSSIVFFSRALRVGPVRISPEHIHLGSHSFVESVLYAARSGSRLVVLCAEDWGTTEEHRQANRNLARELGVEVCVLDEMEDAE
ncbi:MAG: hypothetical protein JW934_21230 [Anaerolineae bacterium]|nr:hypothetical protein [Anaerolineae bacterium]